MLFRDHEKLSNQAMRDLLSWLTGFYGDTEENSLRRLQQEINRMLWRPYRDAEMIDAVVTRLALVQIEEQRRGRRIANFRGLLKRVVWTICYERDEWDSKNPDLVVDEPDSVGVDLIASVAERIKQREDELKRNCYRECLQQNTEMLTILPTYYPDEQTKRGDLAKQRTQLAQAVLNTLDTDGSRKKNTLQVRILRFREDSLEDCVRNCFDSESAQDIELERLRQEQQHISN